MALGLAQAIVDGFSSADFKTHFTAKQEQETNMYLEGYSVVLYGEGWS